MCPQNPSWLRKAAKVVREGFKDKYKWWAAVELGRRFVLILSIVAFTGSEVSIYGTVEPLNNVTLG